MSDPLEFPFTAPPAPGTAVAVAPGVRWLRMPLPFQLDHINLWLLEDGEGWTIVDCGLGNAATRTLWERVLAAEVGDRPVRRVIVTHYHPDHAGNAAWLCRRFAAGLWMTQAEYLTAHAVREGSAGYAAEGALTLFAANGLAPEERAQLAGRGAHYRDHVPEFPTCFRRLFDGERIEIGGRHWRVVVGHGHAPEHMSLHCEAAGLLISGDMLLPRISTNISVWPVDPLGNPLAAFLASIERLRTLPASTLVLPSHGLPFRGVQTRIDQLQAHHAARLAELLAACRGAPHTAATALAVLFPRPLDAHQRFFALGEVLAHLHHLWYEGRLERHEQDGVARFLAA